MKKKKHGFIKLVLSITALFGMGALLSGCTLSYKNVKLHTKEEMQDIVNDRYGEAEFISMEEDKEKWKRTFTFRDKKYGFTYQVESHPNSVGMDGSTFFYDGAGIRFDYKEPFLKYFEETEAPVFSKAGIKLCDSLQFDKPTGSVRKFSLESKILFSTSEKWEEDMRYVWERIQEYSNVPEIFKGYELLVYDTDHGEYLGSRKAEGFTTAEAQRAEYYMYEACSIGGISDIQYLRTEKKRVDEVPGLSEQSFYNKHIKNSNAEVTVYYFSYEGEEYFIVDTWVAQSECGGGGGIFQYYQNYKYYDVVP